MDLDELLSCGNTDERYAQLVWYKRWWFGVIKPKLALPVPKKLVLKDWRLGLARWFLLVLVGIYVVYSMIAKHEFLVRENPTAVVQFELRAPSLVNTQVEMATEWSGGGKNYCVDKDLYTYTSDQLDRIIACRATALEQMMDSRESSVMLATGIQETIWRRVPTNLSSAECPQTLEDAGVNCGGDRYGTTGEVTYVPGHSVSARIDASGAGTCGCAHQNKFFTTGLDTVQLGVNHMYSTISLSGSLPETHIRKYGSNVDKKVFDAGRLPIGTVAEWLSWMEVDLDLPADKEPNKQWLSDDPDTLARLLGGMDQVERFDYPYLRLTGLQVQVRMDYYNYEEAPGLKKFGVRPNAPVICIMTLHPYIVWTYNFPEQVYLGNFPHSREQAVSTELFGVSMEVTTGGQIGTFDLTITVSTLVNALVLMGLTDTVLIICARFCFGQKSRFYNDMLYEKVKLVNDYARFAVRSMVGSMVFDLIDTGREGEIEKDEIFQHLHKVLFLQGVDPKSTGSLVEFIFDVADDSKNNQEDMDTTFDTSQPYLPPEVIEANRLAKEMEEAEQKSKKKSRKAEKKNMTKEVVIDGRKQIVKGDPNEIQKDPTINREEWVNIFNGPPCNVQSMISLITHKGKQGKYKITEEQYKEYKKISDKVQERMEKEKATPPTDEAKAKELKEAQDGMELVTKQGRELEKFKKELIKLEREVEKLSGKKKKE